MSDPTATSETTRHPRGVVDVTWDNLGDGFRMKCYCGWTTIPSASIVDAALDMEDHWEDSTDG